MAIPLSLVVLFLLLLNGALLYSLSHRLISLYRQIKKRRGQRFDRRCTHFNLHPVQPSDIVFLGDSITEGGEWPALFPNVPVRNFGIGSDTTAGVLSRLDPIIAGQPKAIFLLIGTNDIGQNIPPTETLQNYRSIMSWIRQEAPETKLYIQSILPRKASEHTAVTSLNKELHNLARELSCTYLDLFPRFQQRADSLETDSQSTSSHRTPIAPQFSNDNLHLTGQGYLQWQQQLFPHVNEVSG